MIETNFISTEYLSANGEKYRVTVSYGPEAGIPEGAVLDVSEIPEASEDYLSYLEKSTDALGVEPGDLGYAKFLDIRILDGKGEKLEIKAPVAVEVRLMDLEEAGQQDAELQVIHFAEEGGEERPEILEEAMNDADTVRFEAEGFSIYALVGEKVMTMEVLKASGENFFVSLSYEEGAFSDGAVLQAAEVRQDGSGSDDAERYAALAEAAKDKLLSDGKISAESADNLYMRFIDVTVLASGGEAVQPAEGKTVNLRIGYRAVGEETIPDGAVHVVHFKKEAGEGSSASAETELLESKSIGQEGDYRTVEFSQGSFSVDAIVVTGIRDRDEITAKLYVPDASNKTTGYKELDITETTPEKPVGWDTAAGNVRQLKVTAKLKAAEEHKLLIQVPAGYHITKYTVIDGTTPVAGFTGEPLASEYKNYVTASRMKASTAPTHVVVDNITVLGQTGQRQMAGYWGYNNNDSKLKGYLYCGDLEYAFTSQQCTVAVDVFLEIDQELLAHGPKRDTKEAMDPIIISTSAAGIQTRECRLYAEAENVPEIYFDSLGSLEQGKQGAVVYTPPKEDGKTPARSSRFGIRTRLYNYSSVTDLRSSFFEKMTYYISYPEGLFFEPGSLYIGYEDVGTPNEEKLPKDGEWHEVKTGLVRAKIEEGEGGGGTITCEMKKGSVIHAGQIEAFFTANLDAGSQTHYFEADAVASSAGYDIDQEKNNGKGVARIETRAEVERNGSVTKADPIFYYRVFRSSETDIRISHSTKKIRDISDDFQTDRYNYWLGAFSVNSESPRDNNVWYFEQDGFLRISDLLLHGKNIRDITVVTTKGNVYTFPEKLGQDAASGTGVSLKKYGPLQLGEGDYIKSCMFTNNIDAVATGISTTYGTFCYWGQFGESGQRGQVTLALLQDGTTYEYMKKYVTEDSHSITDLYQKRNTISTSGSTEHTVSAQGKTEIAWQNSGFASCSTSVQNKAAEAKSGSVFHTEDTLTFTSTAHSGFNISSQDMIIAPDIAINLPKGMAVTGKVTAQIGTKEIELELQPKKSKTHENGWTTAVYNAKEKERLDFVAVERKGAYGETEGSTSITVSFDAYISTSCLGGTFSLKDVVMWDPGVARDSSNKDAYGAIKSNQSADITVADENNFLGKGEKYKVAAGDGNFSINVLPGLNVDTAIRAAGEADFYQCNGDGDYASMAPVVPGGEAELRLSYRSTSTTPYYKGTVIYLPVPKEGVNYTRYFENTALSRPDSHEEDGGAKTFGFSMDLEEPVALSGTAGSDTTVWKSYYALESDKIQANETAYSYSASASGQDTWEPVVGKDGNEVQWHDEITDEQLKEVVMVKLVAQGDIPKDGEGTVVLELRVHDTGSDGAAIGNSFDYWRAYEKHVLDRERLSGNWGYTSVLAATPVMEAFQGQLFVDLDANGEKGATEPAYAGKDFKISLQGQDDTNKFIVQELTLSDGGFAYADGSQKPLYLRYGKYKVTVTDGDSDFSFANSGTEGAGNTPSDASTWRNNLFGTGTEASWEFMVDNAESAASPVTHEAAFKTHRLGIGLKNVISVVFQGQKTLQGRPLDDKEFSFALAGSDGAGGAAPPMPESAGGDKAFCGADGSFCFGAVSFSAIGTYTYRITEDQGTRAGVTYDTHTETATVVVKEKEGSGGKLEASVSYTGDTGGGQQDTHSRAEFTNIYRASPVSMEVMGRKTLVNETLSDGMFSFTLTPKDASFPMPEGTAAGAGGKKEATASCRSDGSISFGNLVFTEPKTYKYTIKEKTGRGNLGGNVPEEWKDSIEFDSHAATLEVKVAENQAVGKLYIESTSYQNTNAPNYSDSQKGDMAAFTNTVVKQSVVLKKVALGTGEALEGAEFRLYGAGYGADPSAAALLATVTTGSAGTASLEPLRVGDYYLVESEAPAGYARLSAPVKLTVSKQDVKALMDTSALTSTKDRDGYVVEIWNNTGTALPSAGGPGTRAFRLFGIFLVLLGGAGIWLRSPGRRDRAHAERHLPDAGN